MHRLVLSLLALSACACGAETNRYAGYIEGESVRVASPVAGRLTVLAVARGVEARAGDPLFTLEQDREQAAVSEATLGITASRAQVDQAVAQQKLAESNYQRLRDLRSREGLASQADLDKARADLDGARARVRTLEAQRSAAQAQASQAQWQLTQKTVAAPVTGLVEDTIYRVGEWVPAGAPVVSLLPPENRVVRFFVPQAIAGSLAPGQAVQVHCDGCPAVVAAKLSFISPQAEYTPPVIYSRDSRQKLVFLIEARVEPAQAATLHPGQPVDVELGGR